MAHEQAQAALRVIHIGAGRVIDAVAAQFLAGHFLKKHLVVLGHQLGRFEVAIQPDEGRIKGRHVLRQQRLRVALRIDGDEQHLHAFRILGAELGQHVLHLRERRRAHIRAIGETEEDRHYAALVVRQAARLAGVVSEREVFRVIGAGDVGVLELRLVAVASCNKRKRRDGDTKPCSAPVGARQGRGGITHDQNPISGAT